MGTPITDEIAQKISDDTLEAVTALMPKAPEWMVTGIMNTITEMVASTEVETPEDAYGFISERIGEVSQFLMIDEPENAFTRLNDFIIESKWGALTLEIKGGVPVMIREYRRDIKL